MIGQCRESLKCLKVSRVTLRCRVSGKVARRSGTLLAVSYSIVTYDANVGQEFDQGFAVWKMFLKMHSSFCLCLVRSNERR